ncbi:MAG TPA: MarR family transcriptional regulator [Candidatus Blautia stercorigallinarum]|uniref:MarR family transcriptional regulator n=1 Tax=Candidatus Blautia stercorigallinarum TaxID=2838501 RepID=A0A9D1PAZ6_9FIRM|nr:MarR family transcriptional regulator [Candidatus Blautia stercorigallinarum]
MEKNDIRKILHRLDLERRQLMRPRFLEMGLTVGEGQPRILNCLMEQGEMSQRELADACMFDVTTLSRTLDKMEKAGMVTRKVNPASRRAHLIALTPEGKEKAGRVQEQFAWLDQVLWGDIEEKEMESLYRTLEKIEENVKKEK